MNLGELLFELRLDDKNFASGINKNEKIVREFASATIAGSNNIRSSFKLSGESVAVWGTAAEKVTKTIQEFKNKQVELKTKMEDLVASGIDKNVVATSNLGKSYDAVTQQIDAWEKKYTVFGNALEASKARYQVVTSELTKMKATGDTTSETFQKLQKEHDALKNNMAHLSTTTELTNNVLDGLTKTVTKLGIALTAAVTVPLAKLAKEMLTYAGNMQLYQVSFEVMFQSASKAANLITELRIMAAKTPFEMKDLTSGARTLVQFGESAETVMETVRVLGDIAQGNNERFQALSLAYAQMSSAGRLLAQDLYQMVNAGFNPLLYISEKTGKSLIDLREEMRDGAITTEMVKEAFYEATAEGGKFYQGMEKASKTLPGLVSTSKDDVTQMGNTFTDIAM